MNKFSTPRTNKPTQRLSFFLPAAKTWKTLISSQVVNRSCRMLVSHFCHPFQLTFTKHGGCSYLLYFLLISWSQHQQVGCGRFCLDRGFIIIFICLYLCWRDVQCAQVYLEFNVNWERIICPACYRKLIPCWSKIFSKTRHSINQDGLLTDDPSSVFGGTMSTTLYVSCSVVGFGDSFASIPFSLIT